MNREIAQEKTKMLTTTMYLSRSLLHELYGKELSNEEVAELIFSGQIVKKFSYYLPSESLLRKLKIIPSVVVIRPEYYNKIAKKMSFTRKEIQEIFGDVNDDTAKLITEKYFYKKYNYFYKNEVLAELLAEGREEFEI